MAKTQDPCSVEGAYEISSKLKKYWLRRGYQIQVTVHEIPSANSRTPARGDVRTDMINGLPRDFKGKAEDL